MKSDLVMLQGCPLMLMTKQFGNIRFRVRSSLGLRFNSRDLRRQGELDGGGVAIAPTKFEIDDVEFLVPAAQ